MESTIAEDKLFTFYSKMNQLTFCGTWVWKENCHPRIWEVLCSYFSTLETQMQGSPMFVKTPAELPLPGFSKCIQLQATDCWHFPRSKNPTWELCLHLSKQPYNDIFLFIGLGICPLLASIANNMKITQMQNNFHHKYLK